MSYLASPLGGALINQGKRCYYCYTKYNIDLRNYLITATLFKKPLIIALLEADWLVFNVRVSQSALILSQPHSLVDAAHALAACSVT